MTAPALLVATMERNSITMISSEDAHFTNVPGILVENPFVR